MNILFLYLTARSVLRMSSISTQTSIVNVLQRKVHDWHSCSERKEGKKEGRKNFLGLNDIMATRDHDVSSLNYYGFRSNAGENVEWAKETIASEILNQTLTRDWSKRSERERERERERLWQPDGRESVLLKTFKRITFWWITIRRKDVSTDNVWVSSLACTFEVKRACVQMLWAIGLPGSESVGRVCLIVWLFVCKQI